MIKLNGLLPEAAHRIQKVFPEVETVGINIDDGLVDIHIPSSMAIAVNYATVSGILQLVDWDDINKIVTLSEDEFVRFAIV